MVSITTSCGLILGSDQRVDNKSHDYTVVRLDRTTDRAWTLLHVVPVELPKGSRIDSNNIAHGANIASPEEIADISFEHKKTGSIISLNSVCREYREASLEELTEHLLMGLNTRGQVVNQDIEVDGVKALESTVEATMSERRPSGQGQEFPVRVRAVVLRKNGCTYDLMYIARPHAFNELAIHFDHFLKGFHAP